MKVRSSGVKLVEAEVVSSATSAAIAPPGTQTHAAQAASDTTRPASDNGVREAEWVLSDDEVMRI